jgi:hypothetical protein
MMPIPTASERSSVVRAGGVQAGLLATLFALLLWRTWRKWPDAMVDFGRELYAPWRLSEGDVLFRDVAWFNGPLSPYWNALGFELFGVGLSTLVWVNATLFALILALLHAVLRAFVSAWAATAACVLVIACFGFAQLVGIGNYNYITPYSHEATHGVLLTLAALWAANRWGARPSPEWALLTGAFVGLALLTKPEMSLAALVGGLCGLAFHAWGARTALHTQLVALGALGVGMLAPIVAAFALLSLAMPASEAWRGVLGAWPALLSGEVAELAFYRAGMGLDTPGRNALELIKWAGLWAALLGALAGVTSLARRTAYQRAAIVGVGLLGGALTFGLFQLGRLGEVARPWPLFAALVLILSASALARGRAVAATAPRAAFALTALVLLAKMALNVRLSHYGFALAMPATAMLAAMLVDTLPDWLGARGGSPTVFRAGAVGLLTVFAGLHVASTEHIHSFKRDRLGAGADAIVADTRARALGAALDWLERTREPDQPARTLAVFPEGAMLNYLARLENPTPYINFMPPEIVLFGEARILAAFKEAPPDVVLITHKSTAEYGAAFFGVDYARELGAWLRQEYQAVQVFGDPPLQPQSRFGVAVLVRRT